MCSERRAAACAALALVGLWPGSALAHGLIPGANQFYVGLLHPLLAPAHVLALLTLGLALGRGGDSRRDPSVLTLILGLMAGALLSVPLGDPGTDAALLALAVGCALLTAGNRLGPRWLLAALAGAVGLAVGLGSGDPAFTPQQRWVTMGGSLVGAFVIAGHTGFWTEALTALRRLTHAVTAVRIGAAWLAAITLMLLGLTLRG
jgi:urease accessory protein